MKKGPFQVSLPGIQEGKGEPTTARLIGNLGSHSAPCTTEAPPTQTGSELNLVCVYSASPISKMKLHDSGIYPTKHLLSSLENSQHEGSPCALWTSYLAHLFPSKQLSHASILGYLENPGYHVFYPQMFLAFIMLRALSVNVSSPDVDADFRD